MKHLLVGLTLCATPVLADTPNVVTDIAPVHSLVSMIMGEHGAPSLIVQSGASPHDYAMRPSEASAVNKADIVIWMGDVMTPWLHDALDTLAPDAVKVELGELPETSRLPARDDGHDHGGHHDDEDEHEEEHADEQHGYDPHQWLDPNNALAWLDIIADTLATADSEHADDYLANAVDAHRIISAEIESAHERLAIVNERPFIVYHDAYQYFETRFDLHSAGALAIGDATAPSAADLHHVRERIEAQNIGCIFAEPQYNPRLITSVFEGREGNTGVLDPLASTRPLGPELYVLLLRDLTDAVSDCLGTTNN